MNEQLVKNKLYQYLEKIDQDYIERDELKEIFDDSELEISDENGWRSIEALSINDGDFFASFYDQDGNENTDIIYLDKDELNKLNTWLNNKLIK